MSSIKRPEIFLLSLELKGNLEALYSHVIDRLCKSATLKRAKYAFGAIRYLEANNPRCILVTDEGLSKEKNSAVLDKVVSYAHNGGLVIVGLHFALFMDLDYCDKFFSQTFGLSWQPGKYRRADFQLNPSCSLPTGAAANLLPAPYNMDVVQIENARPHEKIFIRMADARTQSLVSPSEYVDQALAAVVGAKVGNGYLVYNGDVKVQEGSIDIILSLSGLSHGNDEAKEAATDS